MIYIHVRHTQEVPFLHILQSSYPEHKFAICNKSIPGSIILHNLDFLPYYPVMSQFYSVKIPKYLHGGFTCSKNTSYNIYVKNIPLTESNLVQYGSSYKYYLMLKEDFDVLLCAKLFLMKRPIITDSTNASYQDLCIYTEDLPSTLEAWNRMSSAEAFAVGNMHYERYIKTAPIMLVENMEQYETSDLCVDSYVEDKYETFEQAPTYAEEKDGKVTQRLQLTPTDGSESLPLITLVTMIDQPLTFHEKALLSWNWRTSKYPSHKISWIVGLPSGLVLDWSGPGCVQYHYDKSLSELLALCVTEIKIMMQPGIYYFPHSMYAKVKLLLDYPDKSLVGSNICNIYNVISNTCYLETEELPQLYSLGGRNILHDGYKRGVLLFPYSYNCVKVNIARTDRDTDIIRNASVKLFDYETQNLMNKIYRKTPVENE